MKKVFRTLLFTILLSLGVISSVTFASTKDAEPVAAENESHGYLNIYLYGYWMGGTSDVKNQNDPHRKFLYDSTKEAYVLDFVLYEGDSFVPYVVGVNNYVYFNADVEQDAIDNFSENNLIRQTSTNFFVVQKTGTYHFELSNVIEESAAKDYPKLWNDLSNNFVTYTSDSTDFINPVGNCVIWLYGAFDGGAFSTSEIAGKKFAYNQATKCYELTVGLYAGDIFCPYVKTPFTGYISFLNNAYVQEKLTENHLSFNSSNYFVCLKDGTYKISISYKIEYYTNRAFNWAKDGGGSITYVSSELPETPVKGNETLLLTGNILGESISQSASTYAFNYDAANKRYVIKAKFNKDDYFTIFLKSRGTYINYLLNDTYAKSVFDGAGITNFKTSNREHLLINVSGIYEISIGANVENLSNATDTWKSHGNSYIRLVGNDSTATYVILGERSNLKNIVYTEKSGSGIKQYGINGINVSPVSNVIIDSNDLGFSIKGSILRIGFDSTYSTTFKLTSVGDDEKIIEGELKNGVAYGFNFDGQNEILGKACDYLYFLESRFAKPSDGSSKFSHFKYMDATSAKECVEKYNSLSSDVKKIVDGSSFKCTEGDALIKEYKTPAAISELKSIISRESPVKKFILGIGISVVVAVFIAFVLFAFKRHSEPLDYAENDQGLKEKNSEEETNEIDL